MKWLSCAKMNMKSPAGSYLSGIVLWYTPLSDKLEYWLLQSKQAALASHYLAETEMQHLL